MSAFGGLNIFWITLPIWHILNAWHKRRLNISILTQIKIIIYIENVQIKWHLVNVFLHRSCRKTRAKSLVFYAIYTVGLKYVKISDWPTRRFGSVQPNRSDKQWVWSVLAKNFQTPNSSVALFFIFFQFFPYKSSTRYLVVHFFYQY